jgi:hypothetical protein
MEGGYGISRHFQQYFNYSMAVSFIGEGHQCKPLIYRKPLTNNIMEKKAINS